MAEPRRITITKRVSLAGLAEGWDDCYAVVTPASYGDFDELGKVDVDKLTRAEDIKLQMNIVKDHFVEGKVKSWGSDELVDMEASDVDSSLELSNQLYTEIMGLKLDPKGSSSAAPSDGPLPNSEGTTGTTLFTGSPTESPSKSSETSASSDTESTSDSPLTTP